MRGLTPVHGPQLTRPPQTLHFQMPGIHSATSTGSHIYPQYQSGKGDKLAQKSRESPPPRSFKTENATGDLEVTGSTRLQNLAVRSIIVFNSTPSGNKLVRGNSYYQSLQLHVEKNISNAFRNMSCISTPMKRTILQFRTGTLNN
eukprot:206711-Pelagomonas_calceolata.AAC.1